MIKVVCIGKIKESTMTYLIDEYRKRMGPIQSIEIVELPNSQNKDTDPEGIIKDESSRILDKLDAKDFVILLDLKGKMLDSPALATLCERGIESGKTLTFVIGGSHGFDVRVQQRADFAWCLSKLTFPHQLVRVILMEQIYRSFMILRNHPYHK